MSCIFSSAAAVAGLIRTKSIKRQRAAHVHQSPRPVEMLEKTSCGQNKKHTCRQSAEGGDTPLIPPLLQSPSWRHCPLVACVQPANSLFRRRCKLTLALFTLGCIFEPLSSVLRCKLHYFSLGQNNEVGTVGKVDLYHCNALVHLSNRK